MTKILFGQYKMTKVPGSHIFVFAHYRDINFFAPENWSTVKKISKGF